VYDITEKYEVAIEILASVGMEQLKNENMRKILGKTITLEAVCKLKKLDKQALEEKLVEAIEAGELGTETEKSLKNMEGEKEIKIAGILPCPVRTPLTDAFEKWMESETFDFKLSYELKAASMGVDWLADSLENGDTDALPDLFISAGFDMFFDKKLFGKYKTENIFEDITEFSAYNKDFHNEAIELKDPSKQYAMLGVVPAVFLVNVEELKGREIPQSWEDILKEEFEGCVSLPIGDFDLFNAILLNIYKTYGEEGLEKLGKSLQRSMHPSEMVKSHIKKREKPVITIMPYFFTKMIKENGPMKAVWPKDGAIISPIFMLSKKEKKKELQTIVDFFASKEVGEILSHNGRFPSVNPEVDNQIPSENQFMWLGWDFLKTEDISLLIKTCEDIFNQNSKEKTK
jgi:ABC-type Fe3+ transport system substrate-binding protein